MRKRDEKSSLSFLPQRPLKVVPAEEAEPVVQSVSAPPALVILEGRLSIIRSLGALKRIPSRRAPDRGTGVDP